MNDSKVATYIGFSIRSSKIALGQDKVFLSPTKVKLIMVDSKVSAGTLKRLATFGLRYKIMVIQCNDLASLTHKPACLVIGLLDKSLASAVIANIDSSSVQNYKIICGGSSIGTKN